MSAQPTTPPEARAETPQHGRNGVEADVIVVGAGPAGSTAARTIAESGASVLLLDRARFPRDKPCGGGVTLRCANLLPFPLDPVIEDVVHGARLRVRDGAEVTRDAREPLTYMTQRRRLDGYLVERACQAGVEFRDGQQVVGVEGLHAGFRVRTKDGAHSTRVVIGADGANGVVGTQLGYEPHEDGAVALEGNVRFPGGVPEEFRGRVVLHFGEMPGGYGWVFPKGDHVNVGVGGWRAEAGALLRPALWRLCRRYGLDPEDVEQLRGHHLPMQRRGARVARDGSALVGDAAGLVDPLSGEGIYAALASGIAVGPAVRDHLDGRAASLEGYQATLERELLAEVETSTALMDIFHARPEPFIWMMQHVGPFWEGACRLIRGETTYVDLSYFAGSPGRGLLGPAAAAGRLLARRHRSANGARR